MERATLANIIAGQAWLPPQMDHEGIDRLLEAANAEGVLALVNSRLDGMPGIDAALRQAFASAAHGVAAETMLRQAECRKVLDVLQAGGIPVLLLKGSALGYWLYPQAFLRECSDIDLLLPSQDAATQAAALLAPNGYQLTPASGDLSYEFLLSRRSFAGAVRVDLDVHWQLSNAAMFVDTLNFDTLEAASIALPALSPHARGLSPVHAFAHACMHRTINVYTGIGDRLKWLYDLHLLAQRLDDEQWLQLQDVCMQGRLNGVCVAGIDAAARVFGAAAPESVMQALRAGRTGEPLDAARLHDWKYMEGRNLAALPGLRLRLRWLWQRMFPSQPYLQELYGSGQGRAALLLVRLRKAMGRLAS